MVSESFNESGSWPAELNVLLVMVVSSLWRLSLRWEAGGAGCTGRRLVGESGHLSTRPDLSRLSPVVWLC